MAEQVCERCVSDGELAKEAQAWADEYLVVRPHDGMEVTYIERKKGELFKKLATALEARIAACGCSKPRLDVIVIRRGLEAAMRWLYRNMRSHVEDRTDSWDEPSYSSEYRADVRAVRAAIDAAKEGR
jgi:hypothetical protein